MSELSQHFRKKNALIGLLAGTTLLFAAAVPVGVYLTARAASQTMRFAVLDGAGTYYFGSLKTFEGAAEFQQKAARAAVFSMYNRNPNGFDDEFTLEHQFNKACVKRIRDRAGQEANDWKRLQVHQKAEVGPVYA